MTDDPPIFDEAAQARNDHERGIVPETERDLLFDLQRYERALAGDLPARDRDMLRRCVDRLRAEIRRTALGRAA